MTSTTPVAPDPASRVRKYRIGGPILGQIVASLEPALALGGAVCALLAVIVGGERGGEGERGELGGGRVI